MRYTIALTIPTLLGLAACGGDDGGGDDTPDAAAAQATVAYNNGTATAPDWTCLGTASDDTATTVDIDLTGKILDFQDDSEEVGSAMVEVFEGIDYQNPVDTAMTGELTGDYEVTLPAGGTRWGFKVSAPDYETTFLLNQYMDPGTAAQTLNVSAISSSIATALPAIIGLTRTPGTGILAGAIRDCAGNEIEHAIATVSGTSGQMDPLPGADTYYLDGDPAFPKRHDQLAHTSSLGLFAVFELPESASAYIQVWGYVDEADTEDGEMSLLAELESPVVGDTVITASIEPLRN